MERDAALQAAHELRTQATAIELFVEEGDRESLKEARDLLKGANNALRGLTEQLQASTTNGMSADDVRDELYQYSGSALVEVCVPDSHVHMNQPSYYLIKSISELVGTSPTVPVINLGECIAS